MFLDLHLMDVFRFQGCICRTRAVLPIEPRLRFEPGAYIVAGLDIRLPNAGAPPPARMSRADGCLIHSLCNDRLDQGFLGGCMISCKRQETVRSLYLLWGHTPEVWNHFCYQLV